MNNIVILALFLAALTLVSYQNCGQTSTGDFSISSAGYTSCEVKSYNSSGASKNSFYVGEIANFSLKTVIDGQTIQYSLQKNGITIQNNNVSSPYYFQLTNKDNNSLGTYVLSMNLLDQGKTVCTKSLSFAVQLEGTKSCQLSALEGTNFKTNEQIKLLITSTPTGLNAFLSEVSGFWSRKVEGATESNIVETIPTPGTYTVYAEVLDGASYLRCAPDVVLTITASVVTPPPVTPPPVTCSWSCRDHTVNGCTLGSLPPSNTCTTNNIGAKTAGNYTCCWEGEAGQFCNNDNESQACTCTCK